MKELAIGVQHLTDSGCVVRLLSVDDADMIQNFLAENSDYVLLESGRLPQPGDGLATLMDVPPDKTRADKFVYGLIGGSGMRVLLDILVDYPQTGIWWIGLLLIHPRDRGAGLGRQIYAAVEQAARDANASAVRLGVLEENQSGYRFWESLGFIPVETKPGRVFGKKIHTVIVMHRHLESG